MSKECENCGNIVLDPHQIIGSHEEFGKVLCVKCHVDARAGDIDIQEGNIDEQEPTPETTYTPEMDMAKENPAETETIEPEELTQEERLKVAEMVGEGEEETRAIAKVTGNYQPIPIEGYTPGQVETIRNTVAKGANDDQLAMFLHLCQTYQLDPFLKEIFYSSDMETIMTSRDGYLKIAQRDKNYKGMKSATVHENDEFKMDVVNNKVTHTFGVKDRGEIVGAWAAVYHEKREPVLFFAPMKEFRKDTGPWKKYESSMIQKCAESPALKRQFGITGLVTKEEMGEE